MKKRIKQITCLLFFCLLFFTGCSSVPKETYADEAFIKSLASGLETGWKLWDEQIKRGTGNTVRSDGYVETSTACIVAERNAILKYEDEKFEDEALREKMSSYLHCLQMQEEALQYAEADLQKYYDIWYPACDERNELIESFVNDYGLEVREEYQEELDALLARAKVRRELENKGKEVDKFLSAIRFELTEVNGEWRTYTAVVENTTGVNFKYLNINMDLLDKDDFVVDVVYDGVEDFKNGDTETFSFSTNQEFLKVQMRIDKEMDLEEFLESINLEE